MNSIFLQVVFKDKIVSLSSDYRDDNKMPIKDIYVLDIYQLASQLFAEADVKGMNISEILRKVSHGLCMHIVCGATWS